jgi:Concanavalin A-like lectin/glucanases superfamily
MGIAQLLLAAGGGGDPYWGNVEILCPYSAANDYTDYSQAGHTGTPTGTAVNAGTDPFGGAHSLLTGGDPTRVSYGVGTDLDLGTRDFTIEFWANIETGRPSGNTGTMFGMVVTPSGAPGGLNIGGSDSTITVRGYTSTGSNFLIMTTGAVVVPNTWHHVALTRQGLNIRLFVDGAYLALATGASAFGYPASQNFHIGNNFGLNDTIYARFSNLRVTMDVARYTTDFTRPTEPFPIGF